MEGNNRRNRGQEMRLRVSTAVFQGPEEQAGQQGLTMRTHTHRLNTLKCMGVGMDRRV